MANQATAGERRRWEYVIGLGCAVGPSLHCQGRLTIHHCFTGAGGRKDHAATICLCWGHHLGPEGIDGQRMSKRAWQEKYGSEEKLLKLTNERLALRGRSPVEVLLDSSAASIAEIEKIVQRVQERKTNV